MVEMERPDDDPADALMARLHRLSEEVARRFFPLVAAVIEELEQEREPFDASIADAVAELALCHIAGGLIEDSDDPQRLERGARIVREVADILADALQEVATDATPTETLQ